MNPWELWKKGFEAWEKTTAEYLEVVLKSPAVLGPAGSLLTAAMKTKSASDRAVASLWGALGLPTKRDQERALHKLNTLESRLLDLEERLEDGFGDGADAVKAG
jgi:hypothetical protein